MLIIIMLEKLDAYCQIPVTKTFFPAAEINLFESKNLVKSGISLGLRAKID